MNFSDLTEHLYQQILKINDPDITGDALKELMERGKITATLTNCMISGQRLVLDAQKARPDMLEYGTSIPKELTVEKYK